MSEISPNNSAQQEAQQVGQQRVRQAQAVLDAHPISGGNQRCLRCDVPGPCPPRRAALDVLDSCDRLPHRQPGATRPELVVTLGARPQKAGSPRFDWLGPARASGRHRRPERDQST